MKHRILIVDDEKNTREGMKWALESSAISIELAANGKEALEKLGKQDFDIILTDLKMPHFDGMDLLKHVKKERIPAEVIMITGHGTVENAVEAMKEGVYDYIIKPINIDELSIKIERLLSSKQMEEQLEEYQRSEEDRFGFHKMIGKSPQMQEIFEIIRQVAPTRASVMIEGESGTGKEMIAHAIHYNSPRRKKPFVKVNCGALTPTLLESELFGHEKGAFTGAIRQRKGRFELADGGTLFLDEITETSPELQVKLLRVLQEQEFERVGGEEVINVDVRIIAATNRPLRQYVEEGKFRDDLYYRLNVIHIEVPPLRERIIDIPLLAKAFFDEFSELHNAEIKNITPEVFQAFESYPWNGNIREMRNIIERMVIMTRTENITVNDLPPEIFGKEPETQLIRIPLGTNLEEIEKQVILETLKWVGGKKTEAAKILGMGRKTLYRKLESYGINEDS